MSRCNNSNHPSIDCQAVKSVDILRIVQQHGYIFIILLTGCKDVNYTAKYNTQLMQMSLLKLCKKEETPASWLMRVVFRLKKQERDVIDESYLHLADGLEYNVLVGMSLMLQKKKRSQM